MRKSVILNDFEGVWLIERDIRHADGTTAQFTGRAVWRPDAAGALAYHESGQMLLASGLRFEGERRYVWTHDLSVWFADGRFFHSVPASGGDTRHWCDPDQYEGHYDFTEWPAFRVTWHVRGPRKDYRMVTRYRRSDDLADAAHGVLG
ncbi:MULTISPECIES: DUF6314 family protein [unclassified Roseovarius]|jgi:hypothetical protein|uniref:DUF6314 family protein n=1 Tax=unclassified Roseovarius TaxID=2614913 RepID=UPI00006874ED|nr:MULTISPECIES: DUF6314 family protein [unclassified Roseovarius]EAQ25135.1 hypothetical protein ROS217_18067 [Roseovarius sp. 217]KJS41692.1 MAG: trigger factor [Roseovarius sp. BRH_c41]